MSWFYRKLVRPALFSLDSEEIHNRTLDALGWLGRHEMLCEALASFYHPPDLPIELFGLRFPNPVGLAAGMDKHAAAVPVWEALGFGFIELGAVTWHPQPGNPAPRMFRAVSDAALINRMGFNNPGAEAIAARLAEWRASGGWPNHPVGINLGKSKISPLESAAEDYANSFRILGPHADFFVVNVSSPNTPNLRQLQDKAALDEILAALQEQQRGVSPASQSSSQLAGETPALHCAKPVLVKVAPDLSFEALDEILELVEPRQIADQRGNRLAIAHVERHGVTTAEIRAVSHGIHVVVRRAGDRHDRTQRRERIGDCSADATRAADNERDFAGKKILPKSRRAHRCVPASNARTSASRGSGATAPKPVVASAAAAFA